MSKFSLNYNSHTTTNSGNVTDATWQLDRDETATLWYALGNYKTTLEQQLRTTQEGDLAGHGAGYYEELHFLYHTLHQVTKLMFELRDNHEPEHPPTTLEQLEQAGVPFELVDHGTNPVRRWLDTD